VDPLLLEAHENKEKNEKELATTIRAYDWNHMKTASTAAFTTLTPIPTRPISSKKSHCIIWDETTKKYL